MGSREQWAKGGTKSGAVGDAAKGQQIDASKSLREETHGRGREERARWLQSRSTVYFMLSDE
jgi:hypothetical protein